MRTLNRSEFVGYARQQMGAAQEIMASHRPAGGWCSCGRLLPCSVAGSAAAARQRYQDSVAALDATMQLPVLAAPAARPRWWRRLLGGAR